MKGLLIILLALVSFAGTMAGILAATGALNADTLAILMGQKEPAPAAEHGDEHHDAGATDLHALQEKDAELARREEAVKRREAELASREQGLEKLRQNIESMQATLETDLVAKEAERDTKITTAVNTIGAMEAERAAEALASFPIEEQAAILNKIEKDKDRAAIIEAMPPDQAGRVLKELSAS